MGWCNDSLQSEDVGCVGSTQGCTGLIGVKALNSPSDWEQCLQDVGWCNDSLQSEDVGWCNEISGFMAVKKCFEIVRTILFEQKPLMGKGEF